MAAEEKLSNDQCVLKGQNKRENKMSGLETKTGGKIKWIDIKRMSTTIDKVNWARERENERERY